MSYVWLGVLLFTLVVEATTAALVAVWFMPGALIALILALLSADIWWQIGAFVAISVVTLFFGRKFFRPFNKKIKTNTEALIGQLAIITEEVCNIEARGVAKLDGKEWSARAEQEDEILPVGERVEVVAIRGVKLICRKVG